MPSNVLILLGGAPVAPPHVSAQQTPPGAGFVSQNLQERLRSLESRVLWTWQGPWTVTAMALRYRVDELILLPSLLLSAGAADTAEGSGPDL